MITPQKRLPATRLLAPISWTILSSHWLSTPESLWSIDFVPMRRVRSW